MATARSTCALDRMPTSASQKQKVLLSAARNLPSARATTMRQAVPSFTATRELAARSSGTGCSTAVKLLQHIATAHKAPGSCWCSMDPRLHNALHTSSSQCCQTYCPPRASCQRIISVYNQSKWPVKHKVQAISDRLDLLRHGCADTSCPKRIAYWVQTRYKHAKQCCACGFHMWCAPSM